MKISDITTKIIKQIENDLIINFMSYDEIAEKHNFEFSKSSYIKNIYSRLSDDRHEASNKIKNLKISVKTKGKIQNYCGNKQRTCSTCGIVYRSNVYETCNKCTNDINQYNQWNGLNYGIDYVICPYCDAKFSVVNDSHLRMHNKVISDVNYHDLKDVACKSQRIQVSPN